MENKILRINSNYNKILLFTYLKYDYILKLIKYNKSTQNLLGITVKNYQTISNYDCSIKIIEIDRLNHDIKEKFLTQIIKYIAHIAFHLICSTYFVIKSLFFRLIIGIIFLLADKILFTLFTVAISEKEDIIYTIVNLIIIKILCVVFDTKKLISEKDENKLNLLPEINKSFILYTFILVFFYIFLRMPKAKHYITKYFIILTYLVFFGITCIYEYFILLKIQIIKEFDKNNISYKDYSYLWENNIVLIYTFFILIILPFLHFPKKVYQIYLKEFKNIKINDYLLPNDFKTTKNKLNYLKDYAKYNLFIHTRTKEENKIIELVNQCRIKNGVPKIDLTYNTLPEFILNDEISEINLLKYKTLFFLGHDKYLFKYKIGEFKNNIEQNKDIILKSNLNIISVIIQNSYEYIYLFEYDKKNKK